jgi:hypothetical protein
MLEDPKEKALDAMYDKLGWVGLAAIILGTVFQIVGIIL